MRQFLAYAWKLLLLRGILAVLFALVAIFLPAIAFSTLILLFGAWLIINGILTIIGSIQSRDQDRNWWIALLTGLVVVALQGQVAAEPVRLIAVAGAAYAAYRTRKMWACILVGMAAYWLLAWLGGGW